MNGADVLNYEKHVHARFKYFVKFSQTTDPSLLNYSKERRGTAKQRPKCRAKEERPKSIKRSNAAEVDVDSRTQFSEKSISVEYYSGVILFHAS